MQESCDKAIKEKKKGFHRTFADCTTFHYNKQIAVQNTCQKLFFRMLLVTKQLE